MASGAEERDVGAGEAVALPGEERAAVQLAAPTSLLGAVEHSHMHGHTEGGKFFYFRLLIFI